MAIDGSQTEYISGEPKFVCDRCGYVRRRSMVRLEWTGNMVCSDTCWDPRPPQLDAPNVYPEGLPIYPSRPEPTPVFITDADPVTRDEV